jgi:hypothetical protein
VEAVRFGDVEVLAFYRESVLRVRMSGLRAGHPLPSGRFMLLISVTG